MRIERGIVVFESLEEVVNPFHSALLVIDIQNDEMSPQGAMAESGVDIGYMRGILQPVLGLMAAARMHGVPIVYTRATKSRDGRFEHGAGLRFVKRKREVGVWDYKLEGTWGNEVADELGPRPDERQIIKFASSALVDTPLDRYLRGAGVRTGIVVGTATEGCVEATVRSLQDHGYYPVIVRDCVTSRFRDLHEAALTVMAGRWDVVPAGRIIAAWDAGDGPPRPGGAGDG